MVWFVVGFVLGAAAVAVFWLVHGRLARQQHQQMRDAFAAMAAEALDANSRRLADLAGASLDSRKQLIDQSITAVNERLEAVRGFIQQVEADRQKHYGELTQRLAGLASTTESLRGALAGSKRLGAWGERMTEDVLRLVGMQEGVNYTKQSSASAESGTPDFTFVLPNNLVVNMDVKFPLAKSLEYLDAADDAQRRAKAKEFVAAFRGHIRAVAGRGYISPRDGTVDYVIVFVPNEQVYSLALELEPALMDEALRLRVVLAGPLTLYALLAVIRQAAEHANILKTADEVIGLLGVVEKQWRRFKQSMDRMGKRLEDAKGEYDLLVGRRTRMLDGPLGKIEQLRSARGLGPAGEGDAESQDSEPPNEA